MFCFERLDQSETREWLTRPISVETVISPTCGRLKNIVHCSFQNWRFLLLVKYFFWKFVITWNWKLYFLWFTSRRFSRRTFSRQKKWRRKSHFLADRCRSYFKCFQSENRTGCCRVGGGRGGGERAGEGGCSTNKGENFPVAQTLLLPPNVDPRGTGC